MLSDHAAPTIEEVRQQIDGIDRRLVGLIAERQKWVMINAFIDLELEHHRAN